MSDMKIELLTANREPLTEGLPFLGSGSEAGAAAMERFRQAGMVDESEFGGEMRDLR